MPERPPNDEPAAAELRRTVAARRSPLRWAWYWLVLVVASLVATLLLALNHLTSRRRSTITRISRRWGQSLLWAAGADLIVESSEIPDGPYVIVANHSSSLDIPAGFATVPVAFCFASRPFFFKVPFLGWSMRMSEHVAIDPKNPRQSIQALRSLDDRFRRGLSVLLFPEGTRSPDGRIRGYKRGPFLAAVRNGVPILPVRLWNFHCALPKGSSWPRPTRVAVQFGAPIPTTGLTPADAKKLADEVRDWTRNAPPPPGLFDAVGRTTTDG